MKFHVSVLLALTLCVGWSLKPTILFGHQAQPEQHDQHHPDATQPPATAGAGQQPDMAKMMAAMKANDQKLDELVKKMNSAQGTAKVGAMAELLTKLVQDDRAMHASMMSNMSMMMNMMGARGRGATVPKK